VDAFLRREGARSAAFHRRRERERDQAAAAASSSSPPSSPDRVDEDVARARETVPAIFFSPDFDLTDPAVFESLLINPTTNNTSSSSPGSQREAHQEQLTNHLDTVEVSLLSQVRRRSDAFFRETSRFQSLTELTDGGCADVDDLRERMESLKRVCVDEPNSVPVRHREKGNLLELQELVRAVRELVGAKDAVVAIMEGKGGREGEALREISRAKGIIREHSLTDLTALDGVFKSLNRCGRVSEASAKQG
jgi:vacuolar protein sorting-associated protein 54